MKVQLMSRRRIVAVVAFIVLTLTSLLIGVGNVRLVDLLQGNVQAWNLVWISRVPRTLAIILAATGASISGLIMQAISRNKFISPGTAGTTDAALLGLLIGYLLLGSQPLMIKLLFAFGFALLSTFVFMAMLRRITFKDLIYVPLLGMMYGAVIASATTFIAHRFDALAVLGSIGVGSFTTMTSGRFELLLVIIPPLLVAFYYAAQFSLVSLGEDFTKNLGVNYRWVVNVGLIIVAIVAAASFVTVGPLPFVGLIIPNLVAQYYGDHVPKSMLDLGLFGASFVLLNDIISRVVIYPYEVAVSFTMGITGGLIFLWLIIRRVHHA